MTLIRSGKKSCRFDLRGPGQILLKQWSVVCEVRNEEQQPEKLPGNSGGIFPGAIRIHASLAAEAGHT
jgi:hypothetical protein